MSAYGLDVFNFEFWNGPTPTVPQYKVVSHHRPGANDLAQQIVGYWGESIQVDLTSHWSSFVNALNAHFLMNAIVGSGPVPVKYADYNWSGLFGVLFNVDALELPGLPQGNPYAAKIKGPGYTFTNGAVLVSRFTLTPQRL